MSDTPPPSPSSTPKRQHGCLFFGCITGAICLVVLLVGFLVLMAMFKRALNQYTDTKPAPLPALKLTQPEIEEIQRKFDNFREAASSGRSTPPLALTSDDLNALLNNKPEFKEAKGKLYVSVEGDRLNAQVSVPMTDLGLTVFKGRYLNGNVICRLNLQNGFLVITPVDIIVKGKSLPPEYMEKIRQQNFATGINNNSQASVGLNRLQDIQVKEGKVILIPKQEK